jgi:DNA-directed RNA polymerase specialized sigma24 family protein
MQHLDELDITRKIFRLPPRLANVAWLRWTGCTYEEIAATLGIPIGTAYRRMHEIRSPRIRRALEM